VLTSEYPRKQVLVTEDRWLAREARKFATVRSVRWLEREIMEVGGQSAAFAIDALAGEAPGVEKAFESLPMPVQKAFAAY